MTDHPVRPRPAIASLPAYVPGARPTDARMHKLSSNENPFEPLEPVREVIAEAASRVNRYPEMYADELVGAIAERFGVAPAGVVASTGSVAVLSHVLQAFCEPGDEVVSAWRSFEAYPILVRLQGAELVQVPLAAGARHDLPAMAAAVTERTRVLLVCTPNNPTGPAVHHDELVELLAAVPERVLVVIDEAYVEFVTDPQAADGLRLLAEHPNVLLLRTFSKAYGLAGLRVGFALAHPQVASAVRTASTPFGVNDLAQTAALASLAAEDALLERVRAVVAERSPGARRAARPGLGRAGPAGQLRLAGHRGPDHGPGLPEPPRTASCSGRSPGTGCASRSARPRRTTPCSRSPRSGRRRPDEAVRRRLGAPHNHAESAL